MTENIVVAVLLLWLLPILIATVQGSGKGRTGFLYGFFLGWIGVIVLATLPGTERSERYHECPFCREQMRVDASVCPHCQRDVGAVAAA